MRDLHGRAAIITGGASGIGEQCAVCLAAQGAKVLIADIEHARAIRVAEAIGAGCIACACDVTDPTSVHGAVDRARNEFGTLNVLVNCAGIGFVGSIEETEPNDMERLWSVNVMGVYNASRTALPYLLEARDGVIVNIGSVAGLVAVKRRFAYCATKGAVLALTRQMAIDYAGTGLRVNCVAPGTVETPFVDAYLARFHRGEEDAVRRDLHARQPIGRMGRPEEIASLVAYLVSPEASFITGSIIAADGGWTAQ